MSIRIQHFFDETTFTLTYVVHKEGNQECIIIDPVLDFDPASGNISNESVTKVISFIKEKNLKPVISLETHVHADHLSGAQALKKQFPNIQIAISERITQVQEIFMPAFNMDEPTDGSQFDTLLKDFEEREIAGIKCVVIPTPGHTPACTSFLFEDALFTGDALFMPDYGVGRCDFPGGGASELYESIMKNIYTLTKEIRVFTGHDYLPGGRKLVFESTVGSSKESNKILKGNTKKEDFVRERTTRDSGLKAPKLLLPSLQVNLVAGRLPTPENNGTRYLKTPLKLSCELS